jgi:hypothetical protein
VNKVERELEEAKHRLWKTTEDVDAAFDRYLDHHTDWSEIFEAALRAASEANGIASMALRLREGAR